MIRRLIWYVLLYCPGPAEGRMYDLELFYLYFLFRVRWDAVRLEVPLYPDRMVVGYPHCPDRVVQVLAPPHRTEVAICASGNPWLGACGRTSLQC